MSEDAQDENSSGEGGTQGRGAGEGRSRPAREADGNGATPTPAGRSRKRAAVTAAVAAAAAGTTAVAANRALKGRARESGPPAGENDGEGARADKPSLFSRAAREASRRGQPLVQALVTAGVEAAKKNLTPAARRAAGAAGRYAATEAPDFIRERLLPPFVDAYQEARTNEAETAS